MKIGLVADTFSVKAGTGIARYSQELLTGLPKLGIDVQPLFLPPPKLPLGTVIHHTTKLPYLISRQAHRFDLVHATSPVCAFGFPLIRHKLKLVTYHDLITLLCQDTSVSSYARLLAPFSLRVGKLADRIIADSYQTREEITAHLGISGDKIAVVNLGVDSRFTPAKTDRRDEHVIGYIGALSRRKKVSYLLRAFRLLKDRCKDAPVRLVICGSHKMEYPALAKLATELDVRDDVEFRGFVAEKALVRTYHSFDVFVFPSEWEGFGLPILEAQRCGVPVVIRQEAHISPEVSRFCVKAGTEADMAEKIYQLVTDQSFRSKVIQDGLEYSRQFTWERTVKETCAAYKELLG